MIDKQTVSKWIAVQMKLVSVVHELNMEGSQVCDIDPEAAVHMFAAANMVDTAMRMVGKAILAASAEQKVAKNGKIKQSDEST